MPRRVWIIESDKQAIRDKYAALYPGGMTKKQRDKLIAEIVASRTAAVDAARASAALNNCSEIAWGVPPIFKNLIGALPVAHEEPDPPVLPPPRDFASEIDVLNAKVAALEKL